MTSIRMLSYTQDWSYVDRHTFELTLELSPGKWPPGETLDALFAANLPALLALPTAAAFGGVRCALTSRATLDLPESCTLP